MNRRGPPGTVDILLKATGVPIDHYSYEAVEQLKDIAARWQTARDLRTLAKCSTNKDSPVCAAIIVPEAEIYAIDVSFAQLKDDGGTRVPESTAHVLRPAARGRRSPACRSGDHHPCVARISAAAEGRWRESPCRSICKRARAGDRPLTFQTCDNLWRQDEIVYENSDADARGRGDEHRHRARQGMQRRQLSRPGASRRQQSVAERSRAAPGDVLQGQGLRRRALRRQDVERSGRDPGIERTERIDPAVRPQRRRRRSQERMGRGIRQEFRRAASCAQGPHRDAQRLDGRREIRRSVLPSSTNRVRGSRWT